MKKNFIPSLWSHHHPRDLDSNVYMNLPYRSLIPLSFSGQLVFVKMLKDFFLCIRIGMQNFDPIVVQH